MARQTRILRIYTLSPAYKSQTGENSRAVLVQQRICSFTFVRSGVDGVSVIFPCFALPQCITLGGAVCLNHGMKTR